jgi:hypothetical protein
MRQSVAGQVECAALPQPRADERIGVGSVTAGEADV